MIVMDDGNGGTEGSEGPTREELVEVGNYPTIILADLAKSKLEMNGIHSDIFDGEHARINWFHTAAIGGIRLMAKRKDSEAAVEILKSEIDIGDDVVSVEEELDRNEYCSVCHSKKLIRIPVVEAAQTGIGSIVNRLVGYTEMLTCEGCGNSWKV
ncbi:MAG: hypothetical protein M3Y08_13630 [Fibrobacterota bacterium]|nr:hypothetical protein [Fibrobacterota bacterium]